MWLGGDVIQYGYFSRTFQPKITFIPEATEVTANPVCLNII